MVKNNNIKKYGFFGWKEFENNRQEIISQYNHGKRGNQSRPVKTEHGKVAEAAIRSWLEKFLPSKYGITSGYIIPDTIVDSNYKVYHYDVIIYDKINSPILWTNSNSDQSSQGRERAIPAKYVHSVSEVKASFTAKHIKEAVEKLQQLNSIIKYLPNTFFSNIIFIELDKNLVEKNGRSVLNKTSILKNLIPNQPIIGYCGGIILSCSLNDEMAGIIHKLNCCEASQQEMPAPLAKDIDGLDIYLNSKGEPTIQGYGSGLMCFAYDGKWHYSKNYGIITRKNTEVISLSWSYNSFARFSLEFLSRLEGIEIKNNTQYFFGQVFDIINKKD